MIVQATVITVDPTADLQAAVDGTPSGGTLRLAAGTYTVPTGGLVLSRGIHIIGSGLNATILEPFSVAANQPVIVVESDASITPDINDILLSDFQIDGGAVDQDNAPADLAGSYGIMLDLDTSQLVRHVSLQRLYIHHCSNTGLYVTGNGGDTAVIGMRMRDCILNENWGDGAFVQGATLISFASNLYSQNYGRGCCFESCSPNVDGDYYEGNCHSALLVDGYDAQLRCYSGVVNLRGLTFEAFNTDSGSAFVQQQATKTGLSIQTCSGRVDACKFFNSASMGGERGIFIDNAAFSPTLEVGACMFDGCYIAISNNLTGGATRNQSIAVQNQHTYEALILGAAGLAIPTFSTTIFQNNMDLGYAPLGQLAFDTDVGAPKVYSQGQWREVVAGQVSYEDESVHYEDEPVTY